LCHNIFCLHYKIRFIRIFERAIDFPLVVAAIMRAELASGRVHTMAEITSREGVDQSYLSRVMTLAFLAPDIIESIIAGRQPADLSVEKLTKRINLPLDWDHQRKLLGYI
jgi:site-specific DNA recombinase